MADAIDRERVVLPADRRLAVAALGRRLVDGHGPAVGLEVGAGDHRDDARPLQRGRGVDPADPRVRVRAPDERHVVEARQGDVARIRGCARDQTRVFLALDLGAHHLHGHRDSLLSGCGVVTRSSDQTSGQGYRMPVESSGNCSAAPSARARARSAARSSGPRSSASGSGRPWAASRLAAARIVLGDRLAREVPDDRAELRLDVEAETVVDRVEAAVSPEEAVPALAVGVVRDEIEGAEARERRAMLRALAEREVVLLELGVDEQLDGARAVRALARERRRDQAEAEGLGQAVGGHLAPVEPSREVPERPLAALGLVHAERGGAPARHLHEEGGVRGPGEPSLDGDLASREELDGRDGGGSRHRPALVGAVPVRAGARWPPGFIGRPQSRHVGRPASTRPARPLHERRDLGAREADAPRRPIASSAAASSSSSGSGSARAPPRWASGSVLRPFLVSVLVLLPDFLDHEHHAVGGLVVADADRAHDPGRRERLDQGEVPARGRRRRRQPLEEAAEVLAEHADLLLLALERHERVVLAGPGGRRRAGPAGRSCRR